MGASVISIVFFTLLYCALCISAVRIPPTRNMEAADHKLFDISSIEEQHRSVHRHAVKSIRSPDGDTIDCIPPSKQLAFHHPLLKDHKFQEAPTNVSHRQASDHNGQGYKVLQLWHQNGRCPNGTIPVRRITAHELSRMSSSLPQYASKYYSDPQLIGGVDHQHSFGYVNTESYYGTQATISLWDPSVELKSEFSLAQLWILATSPSLNSLEAGWQVFPQKYGDNNPRLFVYWTSDNYQQGSGCYNLECSGFVQTSNNVLVGGTLSPVSTINGPQQEIILSVFKDPETGNWWLEFNGESVGYWPQNLSYLTSNYANLLEWGGEIINSEQNGQHTKTQMGSGNFAQDGYEKAAYIRNLQWFDVQKNLHTVSNLQEQAENPTCYNIMTLSADSSWGTYFFFGGPGQNPNCP